jgi:hypothetical protein
VPASNPSGNGSEKLMLEEEVRITKSITKVHTAYRASFQKQALIVERRDSESGDWVEEDASSNGQLS